MLLVAALCGFATPQKQPVTAELIAEHASVRPGGQTRLGVHFDIEDGWHIYAKEPGDAGLPTQITWAGPAGVTFGPLQWPTPQAFLDPGNIRTSGYAGATVLASRLSVASTTTLTTLPLAATVKWWACSDVCVPGSAHLTLTLPVSRTPPAFSTHAELFEHVQE